MELLFVSCQELTAEETEALLAIRRKKKQILEEHRLKKSTADNKPVMPRKHDHNRQFNTGRMGRHLSSLGLDPGAAVERIRSKSRLGRKRERSAGGGDDYAMDIDQQPTKKMRARSRSLSRPHTEALPGMFVALLMVQCEVASYSDIYFCFSLLQC